MHNKTHDTVVSTSRGKPITGTYIKRMAADAEPGYDLSKLRPRAGRPPTGSLPVPVRLDPDLRDAVEARASAEEATTSEIIPEALRVHLHGA